MYVVRGLKTSCRELNNASGLRVGQGSGQLNIRTSLAGKDLPCFEDTPYKPTCGLAHGLNDGLVHKR